VKLELRSVLQFVC